MLEYKTRRTAHVTILDLTGRISLSEALAFGAGSSINLGEVIRKLVEAGHTRILLNLRDVAYIDSSGIGDLFGAQASLQRQGAELRLLNPSKTVRDVLQLTRLDKFIEVKDDEQEAIQSFSKPVAAG